MKQMIRDEYGYINNTGASRYWGVTTSKVAGKNTWVVNVRDTNGNSVKFRAKGFELFENVAAKIAATIYDDSKKFWYTVSTLEYGIVIGNYVYKLNSYNVIKREPTEIDLTKYCTKDNEIRPVPVAPVKEQKQAEGEPAKLTEREIIALVVDGVLTKRISKAGAQIIVSSLEVITYN